MKFAAQISPLLNYLIDVFVHPISLAFIALTDRMTVQVERTKNYAVTVSALITTEMDLLASASRYCFKTVVLLLLMHSLMLILYCCSLYLL